MRRRNNLLEASSNKKGSVLVIGLILLLVAGLLFLITVIGTQHYLLGEVNTMVQDDNSFSTAAKDSISDLESKNNTAWDNAFLFLTIGLLIGLFLAGATLNNNPVILILVILVMIATAYVGMHIVNVYEDVAQETTDSIDFQTHFPKSHIIMSNLVVVIVSGIILLGVGMLVSERIGL